MDFDFTPEQQAFRKEVEEFCKRAVTEEIQDETFRAGSQHSPKLYAEVAKAGFIGAPWPKEYGGRGLGMVERSIFAEVTSYHEAPIGGYGSTVGIVAKAIMNFGSEDQKREFLPPIARGEMLCALGMTEPEAGSDAASLRTRAVADGNDYLVTGSKFFITNADLADLILTVTRTRTDVPKHEGITLFLVPAKTAGVKVNPLWTMSHWRVNEVVYESARVPAHRMLGPLDQGWSCLMRSFDVERAGLGGIRNAKRMFEDLVAYAKETVRDGKPLFERESVRRSLADLAARLEIARLLYYQCAYRHDAGLSIDVPSSMSKLFSSEVYRTLAEVGLEILGPWGQIRRGSPHAKLRGQFELLYRHCVASTIGGGTSQIQLNIIAQRGLGLPR